MPALPLRAFSSLIPRGGTANIIRALIPLVILTDLWMFRRFHLGFDTHQYFDCFYAAYNNLFYNGELAAWAPYRGYGQPFSLSYLQNIATMDYPVFFAGKLLGVRDVLLLFEISLALDHVAFFFGLYLLAELLFRSRPAVLFVCVAALATLAPHYFDYAHVTRIMSLFPLSLYFILAFFRHGKPQYFWLAGVCFSFNSASYVIVFWGVAAAAFTLAMLVFDPGRLRPLLKPSTANLSSFAVFLVTMGIYLYLALTCSDNIAIIQSDRIPESGKSTIQSFLGFRVSELPQDAPPVYRKLANNLNLDSFVRSMLFGDGTFYVSMLAFFCFVWAIIKERSRVFLAILASILALSWLSFCGTFSMLMYYLPMMAKGRYLYMGYHYAQILVLLGAGFAVDNWWSARRPLATAAACAAVMWITVDLLLMYSDTPATPENILIFMAGHRGLFYSLASYLLFALAAFLAAASVARIRDGRWRITAAGLRTPLAAALLAALAFDVAAYLNMNRERHSMRDYSNATLVHKLQWQEERLEKKQELRQCYAVLNAHYFTVYDYAQFDPVEPKLYIMSYAEGIHRMIVSSGGKIKTAGLTPNDDPSFRKILGAGAPKLRLATNAVYAASGDEAAKLMRESKNLYDLPVIEPATFPPPEPKGLDSPAGEIRVTGFTMNSLDAEVDVSAEGGAWLIYADAFHPGWRAAVDGASAPISRAYLGFKALWLQPGTHRVGFSYHTAFTTANTARAALSCLFHLAVFAWLALSFLPRRAAQEACGTSDYGV